MEHLVGKGIDKVIQYIYSARMERWGADKAPYLLSDHLRRFGILASMASGKSMRAVCIKGDTGPRPYLPILNRMAHPAILNDHGFGWSDGESIFLPMSMVDMPDIDGQERLTRLLLFFLSSQIHHHTLKTALANRALLESDRLVADVYWIIENIRIASIIKVSYPGVFRDWDEIVKYLLNRRPGPQHTNKAEQRIEEFLRDSLNATLAGGSASSNGPEESLKMAQAIKERWLRDGVPVRKYRGMVPFTPWGKLLPGRIKAESFNNDETTPVSMQADNPDSRSTDNADDRKTKAETRNRYAATKTTVNEEENGQGLTLNIYDKLLSWADFVNVTRPFDDDPEDDAGKKADNMEELTTAEVNKTTTSFFDADIEKADDYSIASARELDTKKVFTYHEWDYRKQAYRPGASRLGEFIAASESIGAVDAILRDRRAVIKEVTRKFEAITPAATLKSRQLDGEFIDLNAAVEAFSDFEAGKTPSDRLYATYTRNERDISVLFLVDLSMSTDGWVDDHRIIDHEKEALVILCEAMARLKDRHAIYGFSGKTRKDCRYYHIKGFDETYGNRVKERIGSLIPYHYTRMGPAIRHATSLLEKEPSRSRLLFLISDGKPNDIDEYEGRYGIEDTRMAIKEAEREGIIPFCLTVDNAGREYLPRLFGAGNYAVVSGADKLAKSLPDLYARIIRQL
ncbi:MAG: VWA domain-containing protein [Deltaproteobacteria bacterium]|nr:VWA domain-containing protein [Deltaproteobacteria bacterium]